MTFRKIPRDVHEDARDVTRALMGTPEFAKCQAIWDFCNNICQYRTHALQQSKATVPLLTRGLAVKNFMLTLRELPQPSAAGS